MNFFWAIKDIEFFYGNRNEYLYSILPFISKTRRHTSVRKCMDANGNVYIEKGILTNYLVRLKDKSGNWYDYRLKLELIDLSAMQGMIGLKQAEKNVGLTRNSDEELTRYEIEHPEETFLNNPQRFIDYGNKDAENVYYLARKTCEKYNDVAAILNVKPRTYWGLTTGRIVGTMTHEAFGKTPGLDRICKLTCDDGKSITSDLISVVNRKSGSKALAAYANYILETTGNKARAANVHYLSMCDGGRAVRERMFRKVFANSIINPLNNEAKSAIGALIDIDIAGCYGSGLKNQPVAVGVPRLIAVPMKLKDFLNNYVKKKIQINKRKVNKLIPGLWYARINWKKANFNCDLLLSKDKSLESKT